VFWDTSLSGAIISTSDFAGSAIFSA